MPHDHTHWMGLAIEQARAAISSGQSPFGAVLVQGDRLVARGHNHVWAWTDPTAHAEVVCIRHAAKALASIKLDGCTMYTTCEPCPMCASAIHWAGIETVVWGASIADAAEAGFSELWVPAGDLYSLGKSPVKPVAGVSRQACASLFGEFKRAGGKTY